MNFSQPETCQLTMGVLTSLNQSVDLYFSSNSSFGLKAYFKFLISKEALLTPLASREVTPLPEHCNQGSAHVVQTASDPAVEVLFCLLNT